MLRAFIDWISADGSNPSLVLLTADAIVKATVLLLLTAVGAAALRRSSAAMRHRLWALALCGLIAIPALSGAIPGRIISVLPALQGLSGMGVRSDGFVGSTVRREEVRTGVTSEASGANQASSRDRPAGLSTGQTPTSVTSREGAISGWAVPTVAGIGLLWLAGFIAALAPTLMALAGNSWRKRRSSPVADPDWLDLLGGLTREFAIGRRVDLRMSPRPLIPITWGVLKPTILLPEVARQWPDSMRRLVLLHELAHIERRDVATQLLGRLAASLYWFHPLTWYALHRLRVECECAADDRVIGTGERRTDYARQLVDLAKSLRPVGLAAAVPVARRNSLEHRITMLFDEGHAHGPIPGSTAGILFTMSVACVVVMSMVQLTPSIAGEPPKDTNPPAPPKNAAPAKPKAYTHPLTLTGHALDPEGRPIVEARVYLIARRGGYRRLAETTTNVEGQYVFRDVPLPIEPPENRGLRDFGAFQVYGEADGFGFAWRPEKWIFTSPKPKPPSSTYEPDPRDPPSRFETNDEIKLDLHFSPASHIAGTIVDDRGKPIPDARLEIRDCEWLKVVDNVVPGWTLDALNERDTIPPSTKIRTTDALGRFEFTGLPVDCRFRIDLRAKGFPDRWVQAATTPDPQPDHFSLPVFTGELRLVLATPFDIPIQVVYGDTGKPAPKVAVEAAGGSLSVLETSDDRGRATLNLTPGKYLFALLPAYGTDYLRTDSQLVVDAKSPDVPIVARLQPAAVVQVTVVDAETGVGIPDVDLWEQTGPEQHQRELLYFRSWEVATRIARVERPRTDARGKLRTLIQPGKHRLGVAWQHYPAEYDFASALPTDREVEFKAGEITSLKFTMRKHR